MVIAVAIYTYHLIHVLFLTNTEQRYYKWYWGNHRAPISASAVAEVETDAVQAEVAAARAVARASALHAHANSLHQAADDAEAAALQLGNES
ncbi:unnamed protein product [Penicillium glandicola]